MIHTVFTDSEYPWSRITFIQLVSWAQRKISLIQDSIPIQNFELSKPREARPGLSILYSTG